MHSLVNLVALPRQLQTKSLWTLVNPQRLVLSVKRLYQSSQVYLLAKLRKLLILMRHLFTLPHTPYIEKNCVRLRCVVTNIRSIVNKLNKLAVYAKLC